MKKRTTALLCFLLLSLIGCAASRVVTTTRTLDNMDVMGRYVLNDLVVMEVLPLSKRQISIRVNGNGCNFADVGYLSNNNTTLIHGVTFAFSERAALVTGNGLGKCGGEYVKVTFVQG